MLKQIRENNKSQKPEQSIDKKKANLRQYLLTALYALDTNNTKADHPLLTCMLLANISENELPLKILKRGLSQTEDIGDADTAMTKEMDIRSALLRRYKSIVAFAERLNAVTTQTGLKSLETEIHTAL